MSWSPNPAARREILTAMKRRRRALTTAEIAQLSGKTAPAVLQMLYALFRDGVIAREHGPGRVWIWKPTGKRLPKRFTSTATTIREETTSRFNHRALADALRMTARPPVVTATRLHICGGGR